MKIEQPNLTYLIQVNTTAGWKVIAGAMVYGDALRFLEEMHPHESRIFDTELGRAIYLSEVNVDAPSVDGVTDRDYAKWLGGAEALLLS